VPADLTRVNEWMWQTLHGDVALTSLVNGRIYADEAPQQATLPMVVYAYLGGSDKLLTFNARLTSVLYLVRAIADGSSYDPIEAAADRIDDALKLPTQGTIIRDTRITTCQREQPHQRKDSLYGVPIVYLGGFYRIHFQPADQ
jgi:hypothetical protein